LPKERDAARIATEPSSFATPEALSSKLETRILIAQHLKYVVPSEAEKLLEKSTQLGRMLNANSIAKKSGKCRKARSVTAHIEQEHLRYKSPRPEVQV
jgi:hypothetical protein